ncbi:hypothetical protein NCLIV_049260 [Neospora caninum Liverpool]|uniref:THIF-type NAD/FAD binding fold domain-containing protein n=1 Tax=Neospora caninum (strain Liverpool) TaxID=572307 RepID=F0VK96_NEOCL|nr:hypothetical protein NCLIV_049260 [Neospora caninum Liverpool]CBZ54497.1 hypothetical protein NCLIV_049260 [Neospora caninum Liverpool]|eukprot:XP_003884527.1 hypothetical protein NCLIV_049260 [Neospora caninum Liverpool]
MSTPSPFSASLFFSGVFLGTVLGARLARVRLNPPSSSSSASSSFPSLSCLADVLGALWYSSCGSVWGSVWGGSEPRRPSPASPASFGPSATEEPERGDGAREPCSPSELPSPSPRPSAPPDDAGGSTSGDTSGGDSWVDVDSVKGEEGASAREETETERPRDTPPGQRVPRQRDALACGLSARSPTAEKLALPLSPCLVLEVPGESAASRETLDTLFLVRRLGDLPRRLFSGVRWLAGSLARASPAGAETPVGQRDREETLFLGSLRVPDAWWGETAAYAQRFSRQVLLASWGLSAQRRLRQSSVLIVGCGGLGCPAALYLSAAGIGRLGLVDGDDVEVSNLQRQVAHTEARAGWTKVHSLRHSCRAVNSQVRILRWLAVRCLCSGLPGASRLVVVETCPFHISWENALNLVRRFDVVIDATDNQPTRYLLNDACVLADKPLVCGSALRWEGQLCVYNLASASPSSASSTPSSSLRSPCYRCLHPVPSGDAEAGACDVHGVIGPAPGVVGILQALESLKICGGLAQGEDSARLLTFDGLDVDRPFRTFRLRRKREGCEACGTGLQRITSLTPRPEYSVVCPFPVLPAHQRMSSALFTLLFSLHLVLHRQLSCLLTEGGLAGLLLHARQPSLSTGKRAARTHSKRDEAGAGDAGKADDDGKVEGGRSTEAEAASLGGGVRQSESRFGSGLRDPLAMLTSCPSRLSSRPQTAAAKAAFCARLLAFSAGVRGNRDATETTEAGRGAAEATTGDKAAFEQRFASQSGENLDAPGANASYVLLPIDVRPLEHARVGQLPFSIHLPLSQLQKEVDSLRRGQTEAEEAEDLPEEDDWEEEVQEADEKRLQRQREARHEVEWTGEQADECCDRKATTQEERPAMSRTHDLVHMTLLQRFILQHILHLSHSDFRSSHTQRMHVICVLICRRGNDSAIATKLLASLNGETCTVKLQKQGFLSMPIV